MNTVKRYVRKFLALGPRKAFFVLNNKIIATIKGSYWRSRALNKTAHCSWRYIEKKYKAGPFETFFATLKQQSIPPFEDKFFSAVDDEQLLHDAQKVSQGCFDLLGSGNHCFTTIPWHADFRLSQGYEGNNLFPADVYYKEYNIQAGTTESLEKDIKIPWELSRFYHLFVLGSAYKKTGDKQYAQAFIDQINDWIDKNPFLLGPNWVCPMDVAIRALNWVWGFYFFRHCDDIAQEFWQRYTTTLYDHMIYLENNWEVYDSRTSNHYLSDLVGYYYLCYFFQQLPGMRKKALWCFNELMKECDHQIFGCGTSYESSTAYHALITEIFYHVHVLAQGFGHPLTEDFTEKFHNMKIFINECTPYGGSLVHIGDDDSGKICYPDIKKLINYTLFEGGHYYGEFGISLISTEDVHATLRHHAYKERQPSGHFHNDYASITLSLKGIDVFVDPGSYVYTASAVWRNKFRSIKSHSTFHKKGCEPVVLDDQLFRLSMPESSKYHNINYEYYARTYIMNTRHDLYQDDNLSAHREVLYKQAEGIVLINDWWSFIEERENHREIVDTEWNFILAPHINPIIAHDGIILYYNDQELVRIVSPLSFTLHESYVSYSYGSKASSYTLRASIPIFVEQKITTEMVINREHKLFASQP